MEIIVYESRESRLKNPSDTERFDRSCSSLLSVGIEVRRVMCASPSDLPEGSESLSIVTEKGFDSLPICEYQGVDICVGSYPDDQDLADYLDVPDGVLSVNRSQPPSMGNDLPPACSCRPSR